MVGSISDFPKLFAAVRENLNPGGWVEMQDYYVKLQSVDGSLDGTALQRWNDMLNHALSFLGRSGLNTVKYKRWLREAGFEDGEFHSTSRGLLYIYKYSIFLVPLMSSGCNAFKKHQKIACVE